jgi:NhaP-type Na+/H+ or K+/H+ antiporter
MYENLALLAAFVLVYSAVAGAIERTWISGPIVFTLFGLLIGPVVFDLHSMEIDREVIRGLAEVTLALVLFTDAAGADFRVLRKTEGLPTRLLLIGLPLTILLGFAVLWLLTDNLSLFAMAVLATMLAPTDAALGKAVITNKAVPNNIRQGLNVESGLNDGICVPVLLVFLELGLETAEHTGPWTLAMKLVIEEIGIGLAVGLSLTYVAVRLLRVARLRNWLTHTWMQIPVVALALTCFALAQYLGGSGFIAAFSGGILAGIMGMHLSRELHDEYLRASEGIGDTLALITWVIFGSAVVGQAIGYFSWTILLYSLLSLRGLASIVFAVIVLNSGLPDSGPLAMTVVCTIILSIIAHGLTANPWASAYGRRRGGA